MRFTTFASVLALAASINALQITSPKGNNSSLDLSKENTITWTTVSNDPKKADLLLTNNAVNPPIKLTLEKDIDTTTGSFTLDPQTDITTGPTYRFSLINSTTTAILAESEQFSIIKVATEKATPSQTASTPSTPAESSAAAASSTKPASGAERVGAWGLGGLVVAGAFAALL